MHLGNAQIALGEKLNDHFDEVILSDDLFPGGGHFEAI